LFDLAAAVSLALSLIGSPYVYGGTGKPCTPAYRRQRMAQYPVHADAIRSSCPVLSGRADSCSSCAYHGKPCFDCAQLVRAVLRAYGIPGVPSGASSLWRRDELWTSKGKIDFNAASSTFCAVFRRDRSGSLLRPMSHAGISLGNGSVVDARSSRRGVILSPISSYPWTDSAFLAGSAGECDLKLTADILSSITFGDRGPSVAAMQRRLVSFGFPLPRYGVDGIFGRETAAALRAFQRKEGIPVSGFADLTTLERMCSL